MQIAFGVQCWMVQCIQWPDDIFFQTNFNTFWKPTKLFYLNWSPKQFAQFTQGPFHHQCNLLVVYNQRIAHFAWPRPNNSMLILIRWLISIIELDTKFSFGVVSFANCPLHLPYKMIPKRVDVLMSPARKRMVRKKNKVWWSSRKVEH